MAEKKKYYRVPELVEITGICAKLIRQHVKEGKFGPDVLRVGPVYLVPESGLDHWTSARRLFK